MPDGKELPGLGGGGGGTNAITAKAKGKTLKNRIKDVGKILTFPISRRNIKPDPTEKFATEGVASLAVKGGSKLIPALMTGIGAAGTILQAKRGRPEGGAAKRYKRKNPNKKRTLSAAEKKIFGGQKKDIMQKGSDELKTKGLIKRGDKFTKQTTRGTSKNSDAGYTTTPEPTIEKPPTFTGRVDPTKGAPTPKRTTFKKQTKLTPENQFEDAAPTNSMGGGAIAGSVEAGDNPPVNKKKKKGEPTIIARGCMPGARGRFKGGVELLASFKKNKYT